MILNNYIDYFRNLAVTHSAIMHVASAETGDSLPQYQKFATYNATDVIMKRLRTKIGFPALLAEIYEVNTKSQNAYDVKGDYLGAFMVVDHAIPNNNADELAKLASTEIIVWQIINQMWQDHYGPNKTRCTSPFAGIDLNLNIVAVGPVFDNEFGWRCEFGFKPKLPFNIIKPLDPSPFQ